MSLIDSGLRSPTGGATAQNDLARNGRALPALGYMSLADDGRADGLAPALQAHSIEHACRHRDLGLVKLVHDVEPAPGKAVLRPGLQRAMEPHRPGRGLLPGGRGNRPRGHRLPCGPRRVAGVIREGGHGARLLVPDLDLVTGTATGGLAARALSAQTRSCTQQSGCVNEMWPSFIHQ